MPTITERSPLYQMRRLYLDFMARNSTAGNTHGGNSMEYVPELAAGSLITAVSNDMMALLICSLKEGESFTMPDAYKSMLEFLGSNHVDTGVLRITC